MTATQQNATTATESQIETNVLDRVLDQPVAATQRFYSAILDQPETMLEYVKLMMAALDIGDGTKPVKESCAAIVASQMVQEGLSYAQMCQKYHFFPWKLEHRSEWVHAELERRGWKWDWETDFGDCEKATFVASKDGGPLKRVTYTMAMARKADLVKPKSGYERRPNSQLRARAITAFATMYEPSIGAGIADDTEAQGLRELTPTASQPATDSKAGFEPATQQRAGLGGQKPESETQPTATTTTTTTEPQPGGKPLETQLQTLDPKSFPRLPKKSWSDAGINTLAQLVAMTEKEHLALPKVGGGAHSATLDMLAKCGHQFAAEQPTGDGEGQQQGSTTDATPKGSDGTDAGAFSVPTAPPEATKSDAEMPDSEHGQWLAEIRRIVTEDASKPDWKTWIKGWMVKLWPQKFSSESDANLMEVAHLGCGMLLICLLARMCGEAIESQLPNVLDGIPKKPVPIDEARKLIEQLRGVLAKNA